MFKWILKRMERRYEDQYYIKNMIQILGSKWTDYKFKDLCPTCSSVVVKSEIKCLPKTFSGDDQLQRTITCSCGFKALETFSKPLFKLNR